MTSLGCPGKVSGQLQSWQPGVKLERSDWLSHGRAHADLKEQTHPLGMVATITSCSHKNMPLMVWYRLGNQWLFSCYFCNPVDNFGIVVGENPSCYGILTLWAVNCLSIVCWELIYDWYHSDLFDNLVLRISYYYGTIMWLISHRIVMTDITETSLQAWWVCYECRMGKSTFFADRSRTVKGLYIAVIEM